MELSTASSALHQASNWVAETAALALKESLAWTIPAIAAVLAPHLSGISEMATTPILADQEKASNAINLFSHAFAHEKPLPLLIDVLRTHPTMQTIQTLVSEYVNAVKASPSKGNSLASALYQLGHSPDAQLQRLLQDTLGGEPLWGLINDELFDSHHFRSFYEGPTEWGPANQWLLDSLLSALSIRHNLSITGNQLGSIVEGLDVEKGDKNAQELVIGACVQLLMAGSNERLVAYVGAPDEIAEKLKTQKENGAVEDVDALGVLDLTIKHAESGLRRQDEVEDVFAILFPHVIR